MPSDHHPIILQNPLHSAVHSAEGTIIPQLEKRSVCCTCLGNKPPTLSLLGAAVLRTGVCLQPSSLGQSDEGRGHNSLSLGYSLLPSQGHQQRVDQPWSTETQTSATRWVACHCKRGLTCSATMAPALLGSSHTVKNTESPLLARNKIESMKMFRGQR